MQDLFGKKDAEVTDTVRFIDADRQPARLMAHSL